MITFKEFLKEVYDKFPDYICLTTNDGQPNSIWIYADKDNYGDDNYDEYKQLYQRLGRGDKTGWIKVVDGNTESYSYLMNKHKMSGTYGIPIEMTRQEFEEFALLELY